MKVISLPLKDVIEITGNQPVDGCVSRKSSFCFEVKVQDGYILYNSLTKECLYFDEAEYIKEDTRNILIQKWYYVPSDFDEIKFVDDIRDIANYTLCQINGFDYYTILPTTDCNARCFYCFEANTRKVIMTDETVDKVINYIDRTRCKDKKLTFQWFGGEPLYNKKAIHDICSALKKKNVDFDSVMISNGILFDVQTIKEAKELWNLKNVQITLDGTEKIYNKVKAYIYENINAYECVLNNIDNLLSSEIEVLIRLNLDAYNAQDMNLLVEELALRYKGQKGLRVYSHTLFEEVGRCISFKRTHERRKKICDFQNVLKEKINSLGLNSQDRIERKFMTHFCMADTYGSIVILPDGHLSKCESCIDKYFVGHVDSDCLDEVMLAKYYRHCENIDECKTCVLYPDCIRLEVCHESGHCYKEFREQKFLKLKKAILNEYELFLKHEKSMTDCKSEKHENV